MEYPTERPAWADGPNILAIQCILSEGWVSVKTLITCRPAWRWTLQTIILKGERNSQKGFEYKEEVCLIYRASLNPPHK